MQEPLPQTDSSIRPATVSPALLRVLPVAVLVTVSVVAVISAAIIVATHRIEWWPAFWVATGVAALGAVISVAIILRSAGKPADFVVTMVMLLAAVRLGVSLIGLIAGVKGFGTVPEPTAALICGYYVATLFVESFLVSRALKAQSAGTDETLRGKQG